MCDLWPRPLLLLLQSQILMAFPTHIFFTLPVLKVLFPLQQTLNLTVQAIQTQNPLPLLSQKSPVILERKNNTYTFENLLCLSFLNPIIQTFIKKLN